MGTAQSSKRGATAVDDAGVPVSGHHGHFGHSRDGGTHSDESASDLGLKRRGLAALGTSMPSHEDELGSSEVPESVNQLLQASLGDEPGLNMTTMRHDSNAAELRRPSEMKNDRGKLPTVFRWEHGGDEVYLAGTFSHWKRIPMVRSRDNFYTIYELAEGEHEYKFVVDGVWRCDDKLDTKGSTEQGTVNNVVQVKKSDFEVFEALQNDVQTVVKDDKAASKEPPKRAANENDAPASTPHATLTSMNVPAAYTQEMPSRRSLEFEPPPPALPPHLLQVLLNKDTAANYDPNLLPEPNHVMLNHLYALSIREGVMVLSATHRYRKKYVTTLLYKPIQ